MESSDEHSIQILFGEEESPSGQHVNPGPENHDGSKIEVWKFGILLANFIVELTSIVFDQLSSLHKPFLLPCLIMSISAVLICILELFYNYKLRGVTNWRSWLSLCNIALPCAFGQFIITTVNYSLYRKYGNAPIKVSIWSTIFAFGQLCSSLSSKGAKTKTKAKHDPASTPKPVPESELVSVRAWPQTNPYLPMLRGRVKNAILARIICGTNGTAVTMSDLGPGAGSYLSFLESFGMSI